MMIRNTLALLLALFVSQMFGETTNEVSHCNYLLRENDVTDDAANRFVSKLMSKMTYEEKRGQLNLLTQSDFVTGEARNHGFETKLKQGRVGGVLNMVGVAKIREAQRVAVEETRLGIPLLFGFDVIHGYKTIFPIPLAMSASWHPEAVVDAASIATLEAASAGLNWVFSPMVDICRDGRWGRIAEGSGEDPFLGSVMARAMVRGIQGDATFSGNDKVLACMKHFALYGAAEAGLDYTKADMSRHTMYNDYFPPYRAAVEAGVASVMASFNDVEGLPATGNSWLMNNVLREQWGFGGFVVSDFTGVSEMALHGVARSDSVAGLALCAGVDMDMVSERYVNTLKGREQLVDKACRRILLAKYRLGLFDDPYKYCDPERERQNIYKEENLEKACQMAKETFVLLKNKDRVLPLKGGERVALIGPLADSHGESLGNWCARADWRQTPSLREALEARLGKEKIAYAKGCNIYYDMQLNRNAYYPEIDKRSVDEMMREADSVARNADVIVVAMGETANMSGESASRSNLDMPDAQRDLLKRLVTIGKPIVLVLFNGRPMSIKWEKDNLDAILDVWFGGSRAAEAIVSTLYGENNPSGKLTVTFPQTVGQEPMYYNHKTSGRPLGNAQWFSKYRVNYIDISPEPLYPFGYGLSYTDFEYGPVSLSSDSMLRGDTLRVSVRVKNTGRYDGVEIVQLYLRDVISKATRPVKELKGFERVALKAGEEREVSFPITYDMLKYYDYNLNYVAEPGDFEVMVGRNSVDLQTLKFKLLE